MAPPSSESLPKTRAAARGVLAAPPLGGLSVFRVPCLSDNYAWVLVDQSTGTVAVVDPAEAAPVAQFVESELDGRLDMILNTHHHGDHVGGNEELVQKYNATVVGAACDARRIPKISVKLSEGQKIRVGESEAVVFETPGHTSGHITFWFEEGKALFPVRRLFSLFLSRSFPSRFSFLVCFVVRDYETCSNRLNNYEKLPKKPKPKSGRHALCPRLRPPLRGRRPSDVDLFVQAASLGRRSSSLLRSRVHPVQRAVGLEPRLEERRASAKDGRDRCRQGSRVCDGAFLAGGRETHKPFSEAF